MPEYQGELGGDTKPLMGGERNGKKQQSSSANHELLPMAYTG